MNPNNDSTTRTDLERNVNGVPKACGDQADSRNGSAAFTVSTDSQRNHPRCAIPLHTYDELVPFVQGFVEEEFNLVVLLGRPGIEESQLIKAHLKGDDVLFIEGHATGFGCHCASFKKRNKPILLDDFSAWQSDRTFIRWFKPIANTDGTKTVCWETDAAGRRRDNIDRSFETTSKLWLNANDWRSVNANVTAIEDRGIVLFFDPSAEEVHRRVLAARWFDAHEICEFIGAHLHLIPAHSMRYYIRLLARIRG